ncbi:GNAT family N-acetyltransferase [Phycisphaerales bacterium AB-hyl4]|uniref:GNAT family N-acetyltransferase n=1 Tax=Natronomicrosphaera hydrolytica TaxID=3242702 RepID=A0ABV4U804_9BACT
MHSEPSNHPFTVRPSTPADQPQVDRLIREGLLPGHVAYEAARADRIRQSIGSDRERFLVAEADGRIIGALAVIEAKADVGHLHWLRVDPQWQTDLEVAKALIRAAAEHARDVGLLKLAMHAPADVEETVTAHYQQLGFVFSRTREIEDLHVLEYYLNLYEKPNPQP